MAEQAAQLVPVSRAYYSALLSEFAATSDDAVIAQLCQASQFEIDQDQRDAWVAEIAVMRSATGASPGGSLIAFELTVPRVGRRIDVLLIVKHVIFVIEFKVGEHEFTAAGLKQVWDYALDLKNFHSTSHTCVIAPILVATGASASRDIEPPEVDTDGVCRPIRVATPQLSQAIEQIICCTSGTEINPANWQTGRYLPTPTIIEAAMALYRGHGVGDLLRYDAGRENLAVTSAAIDRIISDARRHRRKAICFVTGVPGAGKTLVGLNVATQHIDKSNDLHSVYLSGNGPLVAVLCEALARDKYDREKSQGRSVRKNAVRSEVQAFIQNVHHFRDECLRDSKPPFEHVALFDEAQRAWNQRKTADFMQRKRKQPNFAISEPEFLISCMDRHADWSVVVCLVGGGQEIHTGEAGIAEWIHVIRKSFPEWLVHISPRLNDSEYAAGEALKLLEGHPEICVNESLHLAVSIRSFRAEKLSALVKAILDSDTAAARELYAEVGGRYPIVLTRDPRLAKDWVRRRARGSERYGLVASSQAQRLKPHAIDVRVKVNPVDWFLRPASDVRSSFFLEDAASEFDVQGLELDWACVVWDGDLRRAADRWTHWQFRGSKWQRVQAEDRRNYLRNAYRVLLTRARQGMAIVVPAGDARDPTRAAEFYDATFDYLKSIGVAVID